MDPGDKDREIKRLSVTQTSREEIRENLLKTWISEDASTKYRYNVEKLKEDRWIYIRRPAHLNKGCDFKIFVEDLLHYKNGNEKPPSHEDVLSDLKNKLEEDKEKYGVLEDAIKDVYNCEPVESVLNEKAKNLEFERGIAVECLLKLIKWFFIEQDITDWNYSGRDMFMKAIDNIKEKNKENNQIRLDNF